jgi:Glycine zipper 2TM domain
MLNKLIPVIIVALLSGYASAQEGPSSEQILGAIAGGALGSTIGDGDGRKAATVIGAIIGYRMGERVLNPNERREFLSLHRDDFYRFCRRQVPYEYDRRENLRKMWIQGCVDRLHRQQRRLEREAYEDGLRNGPTN